MMNLVNESLMKDKCFIGGAWVSSKDGLVNEVLNPSNHSKVGEVPSLGRAEAKIAINVANKAFTSWKSLAASDRSKIMRRWSQLILSNQDDLAKLLTLEQGKPLSESKGEIVYAASFIDWYAEEALRVNGEVIPAPTNDKRIMVLKQPIGVVAAITPWNFPSAMITRKCAPALAVGCTVVIKPAPDTPLSALALCELADQAGFPKGVVNCLTGPAVEIGKELCSNSLVRKLTFTGSTAVGKILLEQCASTVKKVSLELGGNAPFIVFEDADIQLAVKGAMAAKFRNTGQTCVCTNRFYIHENVVGKFIDQLKEAVLHLKMGDGFEEGVEQGPLISVAAMDKVESHLSDAIDKGAEIVCGGKRHSLGGTFFEPTIVKNVKPEMIMTQEETFGPVAAILTFKTEEEVLEEANKTNSGLAAYFYTQDLNRSWRVSEALEYGIVGVNEGIISNAVAPFGGIKESGLGREGSHHGVDDFLELKYICIGNV